MTRWIVVAILISVALGILFWRFGPALFSGEVSPDPEVTVWIFAEDESFIKPVIEDYLIARPNVKIKLVTQTHINYYPRLQAQLASGKGPDLFPIHSSNVAVLSEYLAAAPESILSVDELSKTYYPVTKQVFSFDNKVYGLPSELDGLVLFANEDILKSANVGATPGWGEFIEGAKKATVKDSAGVIQTAGVAMGSTANVDFWPEILALLFLEQPKGNMVSPGNSDGVEVVRFFSSFVTDPKNKTWDTNLPFSKDLFAQGKLAYYFGTLDSLKDTKSRNPNLNFKSIPIPQLPGKKVGYGSFWGYGVSNRSLFQQSAWELNKYLASPGVLQKINDKRVLAGLLPKAYPRMEMGGLQKNDPVLGSLISSGSNLQGWYLNSNIEDGGVDQEVVTAYKETVDDVLRGSDPLSSLTSLSGKINSILSKYKPLITLK